jgi:hypothetical protein
MHGVQISRPNTPKYTQIHHESNGNENKNVNSSDPKIETYLGLEKTGLKLSHLNPDTFQITYFKIVTSLVV